jgi:hypothetical protein
MGLEGVREAARREKGMQFTALLHHITPQLLAQSFYALPAMQRCAWTVCRGENTRRVFSNGQPICTQGSTVESIGPRRRGGSSFPKPMVGSARCKSESYEQIVARLVRGIDPAHAEACDSISESSN